MDTMAVNLQAYAFKNKLYKSKILLFQALHIKIHYLKNTIKTMQQNIHLINHKWKWWVPSPSIYIMF